MRSLRLKSPAKINLFLKVKNKRTDGFHDIKTLFERIDLSDEIRFRENTTGRIRVTCNHPHVPTGPKNLVFRAARIMQQKYNVQKGVDFKIVKKIPVAAGLAGGSTNAATALLGLNSLWDLKLNKKQLVFLARKIGSDVAFFLEDTSWALGTGRGDRIRRLEIKTKLWHVLVVPRLKMYAKEVYGALKLQLTKAGDNANILIHNLKKNNIANVSHLLANDLEPVVTKLRPNLKILKQRLKSLDTKGVMISGSGPAVFGLVTGRKEGQLIAKKLKRRYSQVFVVKTL